MNRFIVLLLLVLPSCLAYAEVKVPNLDRDSQNEFERLCLSFLPPNDFHDDDFPVDSGYSISSNNGMTFAIDWWWWYPSKPKIEINLEDILGLESRLNEKVLQQPEATKAVAESLLIYSAGLKEKERPVGIFLFLGPTGVGKTELAKALTNEVFKSPANLLRFDMSHFNEPHSSARLIGSPPGYVNHDEGGQLTRHLIAHPQSVVLLDEIEKAHTQVHKVFLPVFDEGFVLDNKNRRIDCSQAIFIMTSNLCGPEIADLYNLGHTAEEIFQIIEPKLMKALSPELYNRVETVLFRPIKKETMGALVDLLLSEVTDRVLMEKKIQVIIDNSLRSFLVEEGFHPLLGARPLKKLIEKKVVATLAHSILTKGIESGATVTLFYNREQDAVIVVPNIE